MNLKSEFPCQGFRKKVFGDQIFYVVLWSKFYSQALRAIFISFYWSICEYWTIEQAQSMGYFWTTEMSSGCLAKMHSEQNFRIISFLLGSKTGSSKELLMGSKAEGWLQSGTSSGRAPWEELMGPLVSHRLHWAWNRARSSGGKEGSLHGQECWTRAVIPLAGVDICELRFSWLH